MDRIEEPRNERSRRTRLAALDAAWEILRTTGPEHVTMAAVATRAGVTRRGLYLHFSSRADLFLALHERIDDRLDLGASVRGIHEAPTAVAALEEFVAHLARYHPQIQLVDSALLRSAETDPDIAKLVERGALIWREGCLSIAQRLANEGQLAEPWTVETAADLMWTFMYPEVLDRLTGSAGWPLERYRELLTVLLHRTLVIDHPAR